MNGPRERMPGGDAGIGMGRAGAARRPRSRRPGRRRRHHARPDPPPCPRSASGFATVAQLRRRPGRGARSAHRAGPGHHRGVRNAPLVPRVRAERRRRADRRGRALAVLPGLRRRVRATRRRSSRTTTPRASAGRSWSTRPRASAAACASWPARRRTTSPRVPSSTRTWVERHAIGRRRHRVRRLARWRGRRLPADVGRGRRRRRDHRVRVLRASPVHAVRGLAVHVGLPGRRHLSNRGRDHPRRREPLHRLRLLRRRLPVRRPLHRAGRGSGAERDAGRRRQVHLVLPPHQPRRPAGLRRGLPRRRPQVRRRQRPDRARSRRSSASARRSRSIPSTARGRGCMYLGPAAEEA